MVTSTDVIAMSTDKDVLAGDASVIGTGAWIKPTGRAVMSSAMVASGGGKPPRSFDVICA